MSANKSKGIQTRMDQYLALEKELQDLSNEMKKCEKQQNELQRKLEANKKEWDKLKELYDQRLKERDQKKDEQQWVDWVMFRINERHAISPYPGMPIFI